MREGDLYCQNLVRYFSCKTLFIFTTLCKFVTFDMIYQVVEYDHSSELFLFQWSSIVSFLNRLYSYISFSTLLKDNHISCVLYFTLKFQWIIYRLCACYSGIEWCLYVLCVLPRYWRLCLCVCYSGISLTVPEGAIKKGGTEEIYLAVCRDDKDRPKVSGK